MAERSYYLRTYHIRHVKDVGAPPDEPKKRKRQYKTSERCVQVMKLADGTRTVEEIATELGITTKEVHAAFNQLRKMGQTPKFKESVFASKNLTKYRNAEIIQMLDDGFTQQEVAEHYGISKNRVSQIKLRFEKKSR